MKINESDNPHDLSIIVTKNAGIWNKISLLEEIGVQNLFPLFFKTEFVLQLGG